MHLETCVLIFPQYFKCVDDPVREDGAVLFFVWRIVIRNFVQGRGVTNLVCRTIAWGRAMSWNGKWVRRDEIKYGFESLFRKKIMRFVDRNLIICVSLRTRKELLTSKKRTIMLEGLIVGLIAGAIAGWIMRGEGYGFIKNLVLGVFGGCVGGWIFDLLNIEWGGILGTIGTAVIGAVALIWIARRISK